MEIGSELLFKMKKKREKQVKEFSFLFKIDYEAKIDYDEIIVA